jgi:hypothetical protein
MSAYSRLKAMREGAVKMIDVRHALARRFIRDLAIQEHSKSDKLMLIGHQMITTTFSGSDVATLGGTGGKLRPAR